MRRTIDRVLELHSEGGVNAVLAGAGRFAELRAWRIMNGPGPGWVNTELCGVEVRAFVDSDVEARRARDLDGEEKLLSWLLDDAGEDGVFWDVGAHSGLYGTVAALRGLKVSSFDPHPWSVARTHKHMSGNGLSFQIRPVALGAEDDESTRFTDGEPHQFRISPSGGSIAPSRRGDGITPAPDVLKIDVNGSEIEVIRGLDGHLGDVRRIQIETHSEITNPGTVRTALEDAGFDVDERVPRRKQIHMMGER